jgi:hypothetical protein
LVKKSKQYLHYILIISYPTGLCLYFQTSQQKELGKKCKYTYIDKLKEEWPIHKELYNNCYSKTKNNILYKAFWSWSL